MTNIAILLILRHIQCRYRLFSFVTVHYVLRAALEKKEQKDGKSKPPFLIQKIHQFIFAAFFEFLMSHSFHRQKLDDFGAENFTTITTNIKKREDGLVEQRSFVGWKYRPCWEKKLKIALLNKTVFKVKI